MTTITQADRDAVNAFHRASFTALFSDGGDKQTVGGNMNKAHTLLLEAFAAHREAAEARAREAQPTSEELADEIAEAISDTFDMDWQPSWAAPNIIAIINRERRLARIEGAKAMQERARRILEVILAAEYPRPVGTSWFPDLRESKHDRCIHDVWMYEPCENCLDAYVSNAITTLDPAQTAGGKP